MAIRSKLHANASQVLHPGESVQAVFCAQTTNPFFALVSIWIIIFKNAYRVVVVTDRRILVCESGRFSTSKVSRLISEHPRTLKIGPPRGVWWRCETLGERLYVHKRFHKDVNAADTAPYIGR